MPFDPAHPANGSSLSSQVMRDQLNALNDDIQTRATTDELNTAIQGTSANTNQVSTLNMNADAAYDQNQMQAVLQKLDEVILAMRR
ncbi:MAG: hypothetical protein JNJ83_13635 [Verrucomicrobiaceae bacterium]|nr:hypothetical protein [Verrucomicrobiaceae bacterium]